MSLLPIYVTNLRQSATYWPPGVANKTGGEDPGAPVVILCRWEAGGKLFRTPEGEELVSSASAYVDRDLAIKGYLAEGDHSAVSNPADLPGVAFQIRNQSDTPDLRATRRLIQVWMT